MRAHLGRGLLDHAIPGARVPGREGNPNPYTPGARASRLKSRTEKEARAAVTPCTPGIAPEHGIALTRARAGGGDASLAG